MTTDLEQRVRQALDEDASKAPRVERAPEGLRRRVRRRQAGTSAAAVIGLAAVAALTVVAVQAFPGDDRFVPQPSDTSTRPIYERTAMLEGFTVTAPSDWYLVDHWTGSQRLAEDFEAGERRTLPVLEVTNFDPGLGRAVCDVPAGAPNPIPPGGVVIFVALADDGAGWDGTEMCGGGSGGPASTESGARPTGVEGEDDRYVAWLMVGEGVSGSDEVYRQAERIFKSVRTRVDWIPPSPPPIDTPGYVLWGGKNDDGSTWTIEARPSERNVELTVLQRATDGSYTQTGLADFDVPPRNVDGTYVGVVDEDAERVEFRFDDGSEPLVARLADLPPSLGYPADAFTFLPASAPWNRGRANAVMPTPEPAEPAETSASPVAIAVSPTVVGEGVSDDRRYRVEMFSYEGPEGPVVMTELYARPLEGYGAWQRIQTSALDPRSPVDHATFSFPWNGTAMPFVTYGIASTQGPASEDVVEVRADFENGGFRIPPPVLHDVTVPVGGLDLGVYAWVQFGYDPTPGEVTAVKADGVAFASQPFVPAPEGAELSSGDSGLTVFLEDTGTYVWRANMTWSNQGVLGDVTIQATPRDATDHPERWPGYSQTLSLAEGFSSTATTMPGREPDGCLRTIIVGVFDPARVSSVVFDGEPLTLTTDDLGAVHSDHAGNTVFWAEACNVDGMNGRISALDARGTVVAEEPLFPAPLPPA